MFMMKEYSPQKSPSVNLKKKKKTTFVDDYGISLPEEAIKRNRKGDSEAVSEASDADQNLTQTLKKDMAQLDKLNMVRKALAFK